MIVANRKVQYMDSLPLHHLKVHSCVKRKL